MSVIINPSKLILVGFILVESVIHCQIIPVRKSLISRGNNEDSIDSVSYSDSSERIPHYLPAQSSDANNIFIKQFSRQKRQGLALLPTEEENGEFV